MKKTLFPFIALTLVPLLLRQCGPSAEMPPKPALAPVKPVQNEYWGVTLEDPYQYMENLEDTVVRNWMIANADYARAVLDRIPGRKALVDKMKEFDERVSDLVTDLTILDNDRYFYLKTTPEDETGKLYFRDGFGGTETLLFDPQTYGEDSLDYVIESISPDFEGDKVAFTVSPNGSEVTTTLIMKVDEGEFFPEGLELAVGGASWLADGDHFLYTKINSKDVHDPTRFMNTRSYLHKVGTDQSEDRVFFSGDKYPSLGIMPQEFPFTIYDQYDNVIYLAFVNVEAYLTLFFAEGSEALGEKVNWKPLCTREDEIQNFYPRDREFYAYTAKGAPNFKVVKTSLDNPDFENATLFIPEPEEGVIEDFSFTKSACYFTVKINGTQTKLYKREEAGRTEVELPVAAGSVYVRTKGHRFEDIWVTLTGWTLDGTRYRYDPNDGSFTVEQLSKHAEYPEFADMVVEELMVPSHDGVKVPLSLIYKKGLKKNGSAPLMIYGYGAYGITTDPVFSPNRLLWCMDGGIWAVAHVRGGGALGDAWRLDGYKTTKPNTWKDLIAVTEYLHRESYSSHEHTAIMGGSAGGILVGRAMTDRPDLFAAALPLVGAMNNVRMEESPNGPTNIAEFGTVKDSVEFLALLEMDSYQHIRDGVKYPATLITAGMNDPRVIAWQPAKFAARLQEANASDKPILFLVDYETGHGIGNTKTKNWEEFADYLSFAFWQEGHPKYQP
jgi:prolyl oligopeptidase